jgi:hypothetical protein
MVSWQAKLSVLLDDFKTTHGIDNRLVVLHQIFDFLVSDLAWKKTDIVKVENIEGFLSAISNKLAVFKNTQTIQPSEREYFRSIEERLGIIKYCHGKTDGYQCSNSIDGKHVYCNAHLIINEKYAKEIDKTVYISLDVSILIAQYIGYE